jgi:hypothetical protein
MESGRTMRYVFEFGGNPFPSREEAERFAHRAAIRRVRGITAQASDDQ